MSKENSQHTLEKNSSAEAHSIFKYYSIENEVEFVKRNPETSIEDKRFYLQESVFRCLGEFVGKIPYTRLTYNQKNDNLYFIGVAEPSINSLIRGASLKGKGSREESELIGFRKIEKAFANGSNFSYWVSPPSNCEGFGDYGFVFALTKNGSQIDEYILRYEDKKENIKKSRELVGDKNLDANTILQNPEIQKVESLQQALEETMRKLAIDEDEINRSLKFEKQIYKELSSWVVQFSDCILNGDIYSAKKIFQAIYNRACDINDVLSKNAISTPDKDYNLETSSLTHQQEIVLFEYYSNKEAVVEGGGTCPSISSKNMFNIIKTGNIGYQQANQIMSHKDIENEDDWEDGKCRVCGKETKVGKCSICKQCVIEKFS